MIYLETEVFFLLVLVALRSYHKIKPKVKPNDKPKVKTNVKPKVNPKDQ